MPVLLIKNKWISVPSEAKDQIIKKWKLKNMFDKEYKYKMGHKGRT